MGGFTWTFLAALALSLGVKFWLDWRQKRAVVEHRDSVPEAFADRVSLAEHQKAADYVVAAQKYARWDRLGQTVLLLCWTIGGGFALLDRLWLGTFNGPMLTGVAVALSYVAVESLVWIPSKYSETFGLEQRFGFNRSTRKTFIGDQLKGLLLAMVLASLLAPTALWLMTTGTLWWLWLWALWLGLMLALAWAFPVIFVPMFNKLTPLEDGPLKQRLEALGARCGFELRGMFVMDGSRRSSKGNAFFSGFGRTKRIVFYDTLLEQLDDDEIEAVLAHELGHFRKRHSLKSLTFMALFALGCAALFGWLRGQPWFFSQLGVPHASDYMAVLLFMQVAPVFFALLKPLGSLLSRKHEFEADAFAAANADGAKLANGLVKLLRENAGTLTPDRLYSSYHHSHPPVPERVAHLKQLATAT
ncbi:MAG: M48 family metallopeptidase [Planctomycetes bacterium]|nr:M48 family metallopeptidase [Planctomycetota bacterium]